MLPYLSLFGRLMPTYGVLGMAGLGFGLLAALLRCKRFGLSRDCLLYTSPSPRDMRRSRMPSSA